MVLVAGTLMCKCYFVWQDEPLKYISVTIFENCSSELLRDFYMDNPYRKLWDKTLIEHEQLQLEESTGTEIGRLVKKFPFLTLREYVLAWRVWQDSKGAFYCLSKVSEILICVLSLCSAIDLYICDY